MINKQYRLTPEEFELVKVVRLFNIKPDKLSEEILVQKTRELQGEKQNTINWKNVFKQ